MDKTRTSVGAVFAIEEAIRERGEVFSGALYARFCTDLTLSEYNAVITSLKKAGHVTESDHHLLTWTGDDL